jgi:hypothetical protein
MKQPIFSNDTAGPLTLDSWADRAPRRVGLTFRAQPKETNEWSVEYAKMHVDQILQLEHPEKYNVQIKNAKGETVFLALKGRVEFPEDVEKFWRECGK